MTERRIPLIAGNLSVEFNRCWMFGKPPLPHGCHEQDLDLFAELGVDAAEDYLFWGAIERGEGDFDFSFHQRNLEQCRERGLQVVAYSWIHALPRWLRHQQSFTPFRCREHDRDCAWPSVFAASTLEFYDRFYAALRREMGNVYESLCVAAPADYGEVGYPTGWGSWVSGDQGPSDHAHTGIWAADPSAVQAHEEFEAAPQSGNAGKSTFADFYIHSMTDFMDRALGIVRRHFPDTPLYLKIGHGGELVAYGIDPTALAKVASRHGAGVRTTQATLPSVHQKRVTSPCLLYDVPFGSESPDDAGRERTNGRLFADASGGAIHYFDFPHSLVGGRDLLAKGAGLLNGVRGQTDIALLFPTTDHRREAGNGFPPLLHDLGEAVRDAFDYEIYDEQAVQDGALASCQVLGWLEGDFLGHETQLAILEYLDHGGNLVVGPAIASGPGKGPLYERVRQTRSQEFVVLNSRPAPSTCIQPGATGDSLVLGGQWHHREDAHQFHSELLGGTPCRWTGPHATLLFGVAPERRYLLEVEYWRHPGAGEHSCQVMLDGETLGALPGIGLKRWATWVDANALHGREQAEVAFDCQPFRPSDFDGKDDHRDLGIVVLWVRWTEDGHHATMEQATAPEFLGRRKPGSSIAPTTVITRQPLAYFLASLTEVAREHSQWFAAFQQEQLSVPPKVRATVFPDRFLFWNPSPSTQTIAQGSEATTFPVEPGELRTLPRKAIAPPQIASSG